MRSVQEGRLRPQVAPVKRLTTMGSRTELIEWLGANWLHPRNLCFAADNRHHGSWPDVRLVPTPHQPFLTQPGLPADVPDLRCGGPCRNRYVVPQTIEACSYWGEPWISLERLLS